MLESFYHVPSCQKASFGDLQSALEPGCRDKRLKAQGAADRFEAFGFVRSTILSRRAGGMFQDLALKVDVVHQIVLPNPYQCSALSAGCHFESFCLTWWRLQACWQ